MNLSPNSLAAVAIALIVAVPTAAGASENAETLYGNHCIQCHGSEIYTREDRKVTSLDGLERQVRRCELSLGLQWFDEDIGDVTAHLNRLFYRFPH